jgi:four helix bundle protein
MQNFRKLKVWQRSHQLTLRVYRLTAKLPADERFGLVSQLRRAVSSVATNIAEGSKRQSKREFARFLNVAEGSLAEVDYLLLLSKDLGYLTEAEVAGQFAEIEEQAKMLSALRVAVSKTVDC